MAKKRVERTNRNTEINRALIENFVSMQKALTNLAVKFEKLSDNISSLLQLFEISAKGFAEKQRISSSDKDREFLDKINTLLEQNKTIAKGLTLMEEKIRERVYGQAPNMPGQQMPVFSPRPMQFRPVMPENPEERPRTKQLPY